MMILAFREPVIVGAPVSTGFWPRSATAGLTGVFALEASRLARNNRDWHHLIDLCVLTETVVVDADGVYDPRLLNDRLLLGLKGTMSELELGILRQRAQEAYRRKILRGEVLTRVPIGYVRSGSHGIEMTPDREVREAIRGVFMHFERLGTLRQVLLWYYREKVMLPVLRVREQASTLLWQLPNYQYFLRLLKNPAYAGTFAYGRTQCRSRVVEGRSRKSSGHKVAMEHWQVLLKDHHAAYISWEQHVENQRILTSNRSKSRAVSCGAAKKGGALLAGLLRCAHCGHKLHVNYRGRDGRAPRYVCMTGTKEQGNPSCLSFGGQRVEKAVVAVVMETCQPLGLEASLQAHDGNRAEEEQKRRALQLAVERARYETNRAQQQYEAVDPANRLVAAELESRWNAALTRLNEAEARLQSEQESSVSLTEQQHRRLLALGDDLTAAWHDVAAPIELKKRILRTIIHEIVVGVPSNADHIELRIHWGGGVHTLLRVHKNRSGRNACATDETVIDLVRELAAIQTDASIAATLNRLGYHTGPGNSWNDNRVRNLRLYHRIPVFAREAERPWFTLAEAADEPSVGVGVVRTMIRHRLLAANQVVKRAPWMIRREDLQRDEVQNYAKNARAGKVVPREDNNQTLIPYL